MTEQELNEKISVLITERDNFAANSNKMIGEFNGKITIYLEWLNSLVADTKLPENAAPDSIEPKS